ncbi:hypothetical protein GS397_01835 [Sphingobium yanoikuyae]|jgi:hypothetical protein|uniref:RNA polymerase sigma factor 70 region 4 type 2 domain-containing protein n=1 Tax=Sphingobium yanoikuyae TaxID=13690 RepID=A0A6P1GCM4_SPHYA|nr:sigma factor-like helix-turn-helix DNA-binding protein [Sphingobium yanoikuyae]QHD65933.1 hypothetical protein GS397_01835 [Sphingobium yanoikuyae]
MPASRDIDPNLQATYRDAVARLPVLTRVILQMHQSNDLPYDEIARHLSIDPVAVIACVAEALSMIVAMLDGDQPRRQRAAQIGPAETALRKRHRRYCEDCIGALGVAAPTIGEKLDDDDRTVAKKLTRATRLLYKAAYFCGRLSLLQIAPRLLSVSGMADRRMFGQFDRKGHAPMPFEAWLRNLCRSPALSVHGA